MISKRTKYAIKALLYLANNDSNQKPVLISDIAKSENISQKFLEAILLEMKNIGFLGSKKGKGGGYFLAKKTNEITLAEIYRNVEGPIAMLPCVSLNFYEVCDDCPDENSCALHNTFIQIRDSTLAIMEKTTLEQMLQRSLK
jgi:Rrf2 family protein